ncbi:LuxR C-terminal-related transcriptional regulator [Wenzhouxiangellaceae bacterium CH-27]|uniref:LuxR C-terminal-related transcriptional regulator n=2 Tax=Elongatibacter sediminis TaxID=3119006 RepID=A0AAW9RDS1_9GAMM
MKSIEIPNFPRDFQRESLKLVNGLLEVKSSAFYLVAPNMRHRGVVTYNLDREADRRYERRYMQLDPLNPSLHEENSESVIHMDSILGPGRVEQLAYYQDFLKPLGLRYVADMFFRADGRIIAVITLLRSLEQGDFSPEHLNVLRTLQPFLEYALNTVYLPERMTERRTIEEKYQLTARELDVLELVLSGAANKLIASELNLGLPTVKTHLQHIYRKTGVATRTELVTKVIADLKVLP